MRLLIPASSRGNNFDAIRLAMALLVVWSHSFALHLGSERTEWISVITDGCYNAGNVAVMAFFVISGYLITESWTRSSSIASFMAKRIRRIYPGYMVATSICAFIVAPLFGGKFPNFAKTIALNLLLRNKVPDAFPLDGHMQPVNGSLWSIPFEFWCYIGVAVAGSLLLKRRPLLFFSLFLMMLGRLLQEATGTMPNLGPVSVIIGSPYILTKIAPSFILGMIAFAYRDRLPRSPYIVFALCSVALVACWINHYAADWLVAPALAYAVFYAAYGKTIRIHEAAKYGDFSYGCYLYAFPIQRILQSNFSLTLAEFIVFSSFLSLLAGVLSWHLVEKQFKGHKRSEGKRPGVAGNSEHGLDLQPEQAASATYSSMTS